MEQGERLDGAGFAGVARACDALAAGEVVAVPNPPPMTYGLVATEARKINAVKGRPLDQTVAVAVHDPAEWRGLASCLDLPAEALEGVGILLDERLSLLLPLRADVPVPRWALPAVQAGQVGAFNPRWSRTAAVWERFPRLYGSSANRTGGGPATSAAEARSAVGDAGVVIDGDVPGERPRLTASTMVRVDRDGRLSLHRSGAQDQAARPGTFPGWLTGRTGMPVD